MHQNWAKMLDQIKRLPGSNQTSRYLASGILKLRDLYHYQLTCQSDGNNQVMVHQAIAQSTVIAHAELEACMEQVLLLEGWDRATLTMPPALRARQLKELLAD